MCNPTHALPAPTAAPFVPQIRLYQDWLQVQRGLHFHDYQALWDWSFRD